MGYVYFSPDKSHYSVPYRYIGKSTQIHYTKSMVEVYHNHERIALHRRNPAKASYNTIREHLSSTHQAYTQWNPEYFKKQAAQHGEHVEALVSGILSNGDYPEVNYKRVMGVIQLSKTYGSKRLNNACERAVAAEAYSYKRVKNMLENNLDQLEIEPKELSGSQSHIPLHTNTRGASYYQ